MESISNPMSYFLLVSASSLFIINRSQLQDANDDVLEVLYIWTVIAQKVEG